MSCGDIGLSRKQRVFVCVEDTCGTLKFPTPSTDFILSAGNSALNQQATFVDSMELRNTLDVLDQFQNVKDPATWTIPMYLRMTGTVGEVPQGDALFQSLQGSKKAATTASLSGAILVAGATVLVDGISNGQLPEVGVVTIGAEKIYYSTLSQGDGATTATLTGLTRGYNSSTATGADDNVDVTLSSIFYEQDTSSPAVSIWVEDDTLVRAISGASVNNCAVTINNEGAVMFTFSGEGMEMVWAGTSALATASIASATTIYVDDGELYKAGSYIWNETKDDNNGTAGYEISSITGNIITLGTVGGIDNAWDIDDVISGYLGAETAIGTAVESRLSDVYLDDVATKTRSMDLTVSVPKTYLNDELGTEFPENFVEDVRDINGSLGLYLRNADVQYFTQGFAGTTKELVISFGDTDGYRMDLVMPKAKIQVPEISQDGAAQAMSVAFKALGTNGGDSLNIVLR